VGYASCTSDGSGAPAGTVVVIEPASPALIAPITVDAYGVTEREQQVIRHVVRRAGTDEIARALYLVPAHRPRPREDHLRQGRRLRPWRTRREALHRVL
jgi:hypothetical protein